MATPKNFTSFLPKPRVGAFGVGADIAFSTITNKMQGRSLGSSILRGGLEGLYFSVAPALAATTQIGIPMLNAGIRGAYAKSRALTERHNEQLRPGTNFTYKDSQAAYTMRQAAVQAIQGSKLNARNALGGEASLMHRSYKR